jgi:tripartite-type tricarboxylate transporter receptor subunit TctC
MRARVAGVLPGVVLALLVALSPASAETDYPSRPVRVVVPFAAGGGADVVARIVAQKLADRLGQGFFVDNRPGAAGNIGIELAAKAAPDGYTLVVVGPNFTTNPHLFAKLTFDPVKDFTPVSLLTAAPYILLVNPTVPARTLPELIALARAQPGALAYGSAGNGTAGHLAMELIKASAGIDLLHVPYKGSPAMLADLMGGQVALGFDNILSSAPHIAAGRLRAIAISGGHRSPALPELPTIAEAALPGFDVTVWQGMLAPAATPPAIVARLDREIRAGMQDPDLRERMAGLGVEVIAGPPAEFAAFIAADLARWGPVIRQSGARID